MTEPVDSSLATSSNEISTAQVVRQIVALRREILTGLLVGAVAAALSISAMFFQDRTYTSTALFAASSRPPSGQAGAVLSILGTVGENSRDDPQFYVSLISSRRVASSVFGKPFPPEIPPMAIEHARREFPKNVGAPVAQATRLIALRVTTTDARLSQLLADRILAALVEFNHSVRRSQVVAEREFAEARRTDLGNALLAAEARMEQFLNRNTSTAGSPRLQFDADRLARDVAMQQQLLTTMATAVEQAKIEEARQTAVFTVIDDPSLPSGPDPRDSITKRSLLFLLAGAALGGGIGLLHQWGVIRRRRMSPPA